MSDAPLLPSLSPAEARQIDQTCDRFETAWKAGRRPRPEEYLGTAGEPRRSALLRQLLLLDWDYRSRAGDDPRVADYHTRFPGDPSLIDDLGREMSGSADDTPHSGPREPKPAGETVADSPRYELLQEVGRGGAGLVFRGRDRVLGREVAVKVLREAYLDTPEVRRRFIEEARVGSQLQHPAIVPVYELGWFQDRRPYFTMKLVEGRTLAAMLKDRADPGQDLARLLGIFEQVCQAMAYAHARQVVHRDLKPANVMVGAFGEVQVMDWGFAKILGEEEAPVAALSPRADATDPVRPLPVSGRSGASLSGVVMGTPAYMPPEQAQGQADLIDQRADVFALGAILCEILTGRPPYVGDAVDEVCRQAAVGDLTEAHARLDACGADEALRELAKRCLTAEREDRPAEAAAVTRDLAAYLASAQERLRQAQLERAAAEARMEEARAKAKAERRARRLTLALAAALLLGTGVAFWLAAAAMAAKHAALAAVAAETEAENRMRQEKDRADANLLATLGVLQKELVGVKQGDQRQWLGKERRKQLQELLDRFEALRQVNADNPSLAALLTQAYAQMAAVQELLGDYGAAERSLNQALALQRRLRQEAPNDPSYRQTLAAVLHDLGRVRANARRTHEAEEAYREAIELHRQLAAASPEASQRDALARDLHDLANLLARDPEQRAKALAASEEAARLHEALAAEQSDPSYQYALSQDRYQMQVLDGAGLDEKEKACRRQIDDLEAAADERRTTPAQSHELAMLYHQLGKLLAQRAREGLAAARNGRPAEVDALAADAENAFERAIELDEELSRDNPDVPRYRHGLAQHYMDIGDLFLWTARHPGKARAPYQAAVELLEALSAKDAAPEGYLGCACEKLGQAWLRPPDPNPQAAADALVKAVEHLEAALKQTPDNATYRKIHADAVQALNQLQADRKQ